MHLVRRSALFLFVSASLTLLAFNGREPGYYHPAENPIATADENIDVVCTEPDASNHIDCSLVIRSGVRHP